MWNSKSCDDVPPDEFLPIIISDISEGLCLDPFGEVIDLDEEPSSVSSCLWEGPNYIQALLCRRPWTRKRIQGPSPLMNIQGIHLALIALSDIVLSILPHAWPPISLSKNPMQ